MLRDLQSQLLTSSHQEQQKESVALREAEQ
jgi:hypothetical protein